MYLTPINRSHRKEDLVTERLKTVTNIKPVTNTEPDVMATAQKSYTDMEEEEKELKIKKAKLARFLQRWPTFSKRLDTALSQFPNTVLSRDIDHSQCRIWLDIDTEIDIPKVSKIMNSHLKAYEVHISPEKRENTVLSIYVGF